MRHRVAPAAAGRAQAGLRPCSEESQSSQARAAPAGLAAGGALERNLLRGQAPPAVVAFIFWPMVFLRQLRAAVFARLTYDGAAISVGNAMDVQSYSVRRHVSGVRHVDPGGGACRTKCERRKRPWHIRSTHDN